VSSLVVKGSPSGGDGHVKRRSASVLDGDRERGINYSSASVPRVVGSESLQLAHSDPKWKKNSTFRQSKKNVRRKGQEYPIARAIYPKMREATLLKHYLCAPDGGNFAD
jgi:hypothetical protein